MTSTLTVREGLSWMPQSWLYDAVLRAIAAALKDSDPEVANFALRRQTDFGLEYSLGKGVKETPADVPGFGIGNWDMTTLEGSTFRTLLDGVYKAFDQSTVWGPGHFDLEMDYIGFITNFSLFKALLRTDPRSGEDTELSGSIVIREGATWTGPAWVYDLVVENLAGYLTFSDPEVSSALLAARAGNERNISFDLRTFEGPRFVRIAQAVEELLPRYGTGFRNAVAAHERLKERPPSEAGSQGFFKVLTPKVEELAELVLNDPRSSA